LRILIVGAGFSGAVVARELAQAGLASLVIDERSHVAGNCYTARDRQTGVLVHRYGPHIFHTNDERVWSYVTRSPR
jgi:UDP-galactopyranose mutase